MIRLYSSDMLIDIPCTLFYLFADQESLLRPDSELRYWMLNGSSWIRRMLGLTQSLNGRRLLPKPRNTKEMSTLERCLRPVLKRAVSYRFGPSL